MRSFSDSDGDGIGDFRGPDRQARLPARPGRHGDLAAAVLPVAAARRRLRHRRLPRRQPGLRHACATSGRFIRAAHERGLRVITELVLNHTSDQHPWFQRARRAPRRAAAGATSTCGATRPSGTATRASSSRTSRPRTGRGTRSPSQYYWHRFYSHQPDLNFDNAEVRRALSSQVDYWFRMGVDGLRLDAVPYLYEREGTSCENLPETHEFLQRAARATSTTHFPNRMLLAEANQWPEDAVEYFGDGDECHMAFHFPLMPRLFMAIQMEDRFPIIDILQQTPEHPRRLPVGAVPAQPRRADARDGHRRGARLHVPRLRARARRRGSTSASAAGWRRCSATTGRKIELMNGLLLSLPGTPVIYYGDEIGMGDNIYLGDRDGVRTPMQWSGDRNAGFSRANPQRLYLPPIIDPEFHYETVNVETQAKNGGSLLWWMRRMLALRKRYDGVRPGRPGVPAPREPPRAGLPAPATTRPQRPDRRQPVALRPVRRARPVALPRRGAGRAVRPDPLPAHRRAAVPAHAGPPRLLLARARGPARGGRGRPSTDDEAPVLECDGSIDAHPRRARARASSSAPSPRFLPGRRWFAGKARVIRSVSVVDALPLTGVRASVSARACSSCASSSPRARRRPTPCRSR